MFLFYHIYKPLKTVDFLRERERERERERNTLPSKYYSRKVASLRRNFFVSFTKDSRRVRICCLSVRRYFQSLAGAFYSFAVGCNIKAALCFRLWRNHAMAMKSLAGRGKFVWQFNHAYAMYSVYTKLDFEKRVVQ